MRLVLVLGDQLTEGAGALARADRTRDVVVMAEVAAEAGCVPHHPQKIALVLAAMRRFAAQLAGQGWRLADTRLDDPGNAGPIPGGAGGGRFPPRWRTSPRDIFGAKTERKKKNARFLACSFAKFSRDDLIR